MNIKMAGVLGIIGIAIIVAIVYTTSQITNTQPVSSKSGEKTTGLVKTMPGDVDRDGKVTISDINLVKEHLGCKKNDSCWNAVIGHTREGDNIMYASDLDENANGMVDEADVPVLGK